VLDEKYSITVGDEHPNAENNGTAKIPVDAN
jgi:hypothetical protein